MRTVARAAIAGLLAFGGLACGPSYVVHTAVSPDAVFTDLQRFHVYTDPPKLEGYAGRIAYDPTLGNPITNRTLNETIARAFLDRGYVVDDAYPDFGVAVYAIATTEQEAMGWDGRYDESRQRGHSPAIDQAVSYIAGTVIVDVVEPAGRGLLWRGSATTRLTENPAQDVEELQRLAREIVKRFPRSRAARLASMR